MALNSCQTLWEINNNKLQGEWILEDVIRPAEKMVKKKSPKLLQSQYLFTLDKK
tara:strand:+ start:208 stop:369 length:162 start_codon:yes stop_codon:yes gene_type:complete